jgi:CarD family transcriptional regulator
LVGQTYSGRRAKGRKKRLANQSRKRIENCCSRKTASKRVGEAIAVEKDTAKKPNSRHDDGKDIAKAYPFYVSFIKYETSTTEILKKAKSKMSKMKSPTTTEFQVNDHVVYPTHGVGKIIAIETQEIAGMSLELFVIRFDNEKMTLRVPTMKAAQTGMRKLSDDTTVADAMKTLKGKAKIKRTMWSRRAQEYEAKINSGNLVSIAEVVRDLYRGEDQPEQSYSERQLFEAAFERLTRELAAVEKIAQSDAAKQVETALDKNAA